MMSGIPQVALIPVAILGIILFLIVVFKLSVLSKHSDHGKAMEDCDFTADFDVKGLLGH